MAKTCAYQSPCWNPLPVKRGNNKPTEQGPWALINSSRSYTFIFTLACAHFLLRFSLYGSCASIVNISYAYWLVPSLQLLPQLMSYLVAPKDSLESLNSGSCRTLQATPQSLNSKRLLQEISHRLLPFFVSNFIASATSRAAPQVWKSFVILSGPVAPILPYCYIVSLYQVLALNGSALARLDKTKLMTCAEFQNLWKDLQPSIMAQNGTAWSRTGPQKSFLKKRLIIQVKFKDIGRNTETLEHLWMISRKRWEETPSIKLKWYRIG